MNKNDMCRKTAAGLCTQIDVSWHSVSGLTLYLNGHLVSSDRFPATNELDYNSTLRFLIGRRADSDMRREHFTNGVVDNVEFYETTRDVLQDKGFLQHRQGRSHGFNWREGWIPPDLRSGTSCLRSTTSNNRSCISQLRSGTFLLGSSSLHCLYLSILLCA